MTFIRKFGGKFIIKAAASVCMAAFLLLLSAGSRPSVPAADVLAQNTPSAETENSESTVPAETVEYTSQASGVQATVFTPNAVTSAQPGIQRLDFSDFAAFYNRHKLFTEICDNIIYTNTYGSCEGGKSTNVVSYYQYNTDSQTISLASRNTYTAKFQYQGYTFSLNFDYFTHNNQLILFDKSLGNSQTSVYVKSIPNQTDRVFITVVLPDNRANTVLYDLQNQKIEKEFKNMYIWAISPDGSMVLYVAKPVEFTDSGEIKKIKTYYLDLNSMKTGETGLEDTCINNVYMSQIGFIDWIDKDTILYYDHYKYNEKDLYNTDSCDLMRKNLKTGKTATVIKGIKPDYGCIHDNATFDGRHILINLNKTIWYYNALTGERNKFPVFNENVQDDDGPELFTVSPDGNYLAFGQGKETDNGYVSQFGILNLHTYQVTVLDEAVNQGGYHHYQWLSDNTLYMDFSEAGKCSIFQIG